MQKRSFYKNYTKYKRNTNQVSLVIQLRHRLLLTTVLFLLALSGRFLVGIFNTTTERAIDTQTIQLNDEINTLTLSMVDQDTGMRTYISWGKAQDLQIFSTGRQHYLSTLTTSTYLLQKQNDKNVLLVLRQTDQQAEIWYSRYALPQKQRITQGRFALAQQIRTSGVSVRLIGQFRSKADHLHIIINENQSTAQRQVDLFNWIILLTSTICSIFIIIAFWYLFHRQTQQINEQLTALKNISQRFTQGKLEERIDLLHYEELNIVGQQLNAMASILQHQQIELEAHAALLDSDLQALLNAAIAAVLFVSPSGTIRAINKYFSEIFSISAQDLLEHKLSELYEHWQKRFSDPASLHMYLETSVNDHEHLLTQTLLLEWPYRREMDFISLPVLSASKQYLGRLYTIRDVTREREVDRLKTEFVSTVSHELRTPLTSIKGFIDVLLDDQESLSDEQHEYLDIIQESSQRLLSIVNDLLDLSHIESGKIVIAQSSLALNVLIQQVIRTFQSALRQKEQELLLKLQEPPLIIMGDEARLTQIMNNLLSNAQKYTPRGGKITITTTQIGEKIQIAIADTGVGMTVEEQGKLFTKFFRAKNRLTEGEGGTGLGLTITRSLVEMHGSSLQVISAPGQGSTFSFALSLVLEESAVATVGNTTTTNSQ